MTTDAGTRKRELALIHIAKAHFAFSREDYVCVLQAATRTTKTSAADLTDHERHQLLAHFKSKGFKVDASKAKTPKARATIDPMHRKLRAMWYALADAGAVERPDSSATCDAAIQAWAKRQLGTQVARLGRFDALRFASGEQLEKLIEEMKQWGRRLQADIH